MLSKKTPLTFDIYDGGQLDAAFVVFRALEFEMLLTQNITTGYLKADAMTTVPPKGTRVGMLPRRVVERHTVAGPRQAAQVQSKKDENPVRFKGLLEKKGQKGAAWRPAGLH
ncbi:hypothetical protein RUM43_001855 [Polyplax serrata]|uniref:Uncharacterized protein n=1 Tax=Polyplax serrata TaxID=468196 RepID=A0AAN8XQH8_POLSC